MKKNNRNSWCKRSMSDTFYFGTIFISLYHVFYASLGSLDGRESTLPLFGCVPLALAVVERVTACGFVVCASEAVEV